MLLHPAAATLEKSLFPPTQLRLLQLLLQCKLGLQGAAHPCCCAGCALEAVRQ
jgi:hypothetical protein